jgi:hypothetical protein
MERPLGELALRNGAFSVQTKPYEIKTLREQFVASMAAAP